MTLELDEKDIANLKEMSRTRNLGLHNRWEVDERYLELTGREDFELGELRIVEIDEINRWYESLINTLGETCRKTAVAKSLRFRGTERIPLDVTTIPVRFTRGVAARPVAAAGFS